MRILITGGVTGYIGSCLGEFLTNSGHSVVLASRKNISPVSFSGRDVVQIFWDEQHSLDTACLEVDIVIHAAGMNKQDCTEKPYEAVMFNGIGTANLLKAAISNGVPQFIYLSSYHVYSNPLKGEISELNCLCNTHPYAISHRVGEDTVRAANQQGLINAMVIRMSNGYGRPPMPDVDCWDLFVNDLCRQAVQKKQLSIRTNGDEQRNFISVKEICSIVNFLIKNPGQTDGKFQDLINIGSDSNTSLFEMAKIIRDRCSKTLGMNVEIINNSHNVASSKADFLFDLDRLHSLGYKSTFSAETEIDDLLIFCNQNFMRS